MRCGSQPGRRRVATGKGDRPVQLCREAASRRGCQTRHRKPGAASPLQPAESNRCRASRLGALLPGFPSVGHRLRAPVPGLRLDKTTDFNREGTRIIGTIPDDGSWDPGSENGQWDKLGQVDSTLGGGTVSPDGRWLAAVADTSGVNEGSGVVIWDLSTKERIAEPLPHPAVTGVLFSPDGDFLLSTSSTGVAKVWNAPNWELLRTFGNHARKNPREADINQAAFNSNGTMVATAADDSTARIWDPSTRRRDSQARSRRLRLVGSVQPGRPICRDGIRGSYRASVVGGERRAKRGDTPSPRASEPGCIQPRRARRGDRLDRQHGAALGCRIRAASRRAASA